MTIAFAEDTLSSTPSTVLPDTMVDIKSSDSVANSNADTVIAAHCISNKGILEI